MPVALVTVGPTKTNLGLANDKGEIYSTSDFLGTSESAAVY